MDPEPTVQAWGDVREFMEPGVPLESGGLRNLITLSYLDSCQACAAGIALTVSRRSIRNPNFEPVQVDGYTTAASCRQSHLVLALCQGEEMHT
jgi:hypothetical protein